ncbi:1,4-alpha-glucan branching protein GlgB [Cytobacillus sp. IB215665]|nr:1,4-alpha-glucan branching protein GlgB [Cytobacillus sp. IB215665]MDX8367396.1 1,4-alpha-glucan branching protein GlgB [Cytobacillus sp. IB215665]
MTVSAPPTDFDLHLFHEGSLFQSHMLFGAHICQKGDVIEGTRFCVWAPHAKSVSIVGTFNDWNGKNFELEKINDEGVWHLFTPVNLAGEIYKYEIITPSNQKILKSDPYAFYSEERPQTGSIVYNMDSYKWRDKKWQNRKQKNVQSKPVFIYELHFGSWKKKADGSHYSYNELAELLIPYVVGNGYTHIELLPLIEHPLDISWGYQGVGYFSATSRYGSPRELMKFIDLCHQQGIGVILDWVPGHFCKDNHGLYMFDGQPTYEYENPQDRENPVWGTANFDLGKPEVQSFLISNALFWIEYFHIDGFRVDAVANMIYWPSTDGHQHLNKGAISFLQKINEVISFYAPETLMIAEDSTDFPQVTGNVPAGGLGFSYKWNMGWMNDILTYMKAEFSDRQYLHDKVTFSLLYAFSEKFLLPLSHDEVVHGKKSLLNKMPGDYWQKFAQLRLLYGYLIAHPGKKLLFMGGEFGQFDEWKDQEQLDWNLQDFVMHQKLHAYVKELLKIYKRNKALYEIDDTHDGFEWIDVNNHEQSIFSFIRKGKNEQDFLIIVCNFTATVYHDYIVGVPSKGEYREILNSDEMDFGGAGNRNSKKIFSNEGTYHGKPYHLAVTIPPLGISIIRPIKKRKERKRADGQKKMHSNDLGRRKR